VTFNLKDFPPERLKPCNLTAQHPDDFIFDLLDLHAARVCEAAANHRRSLSQCFASATRASRSAISAMADWMCTNIVTRPLEEWRARFTDSTGALQAAAPGTALARERIVIPFLAGSGDQGKLLAASGAVQVDGAVESRKTVRIRTSQVVGVEIHVHGPG